MRIDPRKYRGLAGGTLDAAARRVQKKMEERRTRSAAAGDDATSETLAETFGSGFASASPEELRLWCNP